MHTKARKVMIIGAGNVGASAAYALLNQSICEELILVDLNQQRAEAHAQDLSDAAAYLPGMMTISTREASDCADVDIAVITVSGGALRPGIVHRIDRDTSGLIIAAKNDYAHQFLSAQLADHTLARTYECIVVGNLREDSGAVDAPIARDSRDRKRMAVVPGGRRAVTHWEVIARYPGYTHVRCRLETGRTHQIRVHMAYLGHPILGDTVYGAKKAVPGLTGQCLHAVGLQFIHPRTKELVSLTCGLPDEFTAMLRKIDR